MRGPLLLFGGLIFCIVLVGLIATQAYEEFDTINTDQSLTGVESGFVLKIAVIFLLGLVGTFLSLFLVVVMR